MRPLFTLPLPQSLIDALTNAGFTSCDDLFKENGDIDLAANGILQDYFYSVSEIEQLLALPNITSGAFKLRSEQIKESIPTFSEALDNILGGGIQLGTILQVCGSPGSGKTLLALQLCIAVQIPLPLGGLEGQAVYIETDSGFSISRLKEIANGAIKHCHKVAECHNILDNIENFTVDSLLENIHYISARGHVQLLAAVQTLQKFILANQKIKIVIIDCVTFPFLTFTSTLERTRIICTLLNQLEVIANKFEVAVVITNHLTTKLDRNNKYLAPSLGESLSHCIAQTLYLGKVNNNFTAVLTKSPYLPQSAVTFNIVEDGLRDVNNSI